MRSLATILVIAAALPAALADNVPLVRDGEPACVVVLADDASPVARLAASEFQTYIRKASGARIPIMTETEAWPETDGIVLIGPSRLTEALGVHSDELSPEGFRVCTHGNRLVLLGKDRGEVRDGSHVVDPFSPRTQTGTLFAVYRFLENYLGVRWLWPGELGEVVPERKTISLGKIDYVDSPRLLCRVVQSRAWWADYLLHARRIGLTREQGDQRAKEYRLWAKRNGLGVSAVFDTSLSVADRLNHHQDAHREYLGLDGQAGRVPARGQLPCAANAEARLLVAVEASRLLAPHAGRLAVSVSPNDGWGAGCGCPRCRAMDRVNDLAEEPATEDNPVVYDSLSERCAVLWNEVAMHLAARHPEKYVVGQAHGLHRSPPTRSVLLPNVVVNFRGFDYLDDEARARDRRHVRGWAEAGARLYVRLSAPPPVYGMPLRCSSRTGADLRFCGRHRIIGADVGRMDHHWATQGINYYVLVRMLWDPDLVPRQIVRDYCRTGFGIAGPSVERYFQTLEGLREKMVSEEIAGLRDDTAAWLTQLYSAEFLAECDAILAEAERLALREGPGVQQRVAFLRRGLGYARLQVEAMEAMSRHDSTKAEEALRRLHEFYEDEKEGWAVNVPLLLASEEGWRGAEYRMSNIE